MDRNNDIRNSLKKMRTHLKGGEVFYEQSDKKKIITRDPVGKEAMREMLKRARKINESIDGNLKTTELPELDKKNELERLQNTFKHLNPMPNAYIEDFVQIDDTTGDGSAGYFLSGGVDGILTFVITVGKTDEVSNLDVQLENDFDADNPTHEKINELLETYYDDFKENWLKNIHNEEF